ncbi:MAG: ribosome maturation factor RimP [Gammaproteobacteria bacterium]|nr:ribosome maturation factor RimP [Gammaproteobacteria bacterium]
MSLPPTTRLGDIIAPVIELLGFEYVACELVPLGVRMVLRIYIDSEEGVTIRDCEIVSRQVSAALDVEDSVKSKYFLEVSSPGSDRLLVTEAHFQRFIGHRIKVKLRHSRNGRRNYSGLLQAVLDGNITMVVDGDAYVLAVSDIEKANLAPES